jgi:chromate transporter
MIGPLALALPVGASALAPAAPVTLAGIGLVFLKAGALMFGSGYVLFAFLRADLVERLGWLTDQQLLDAISAGQVTPGPLVSSATFVGYVLAGIPGALVATAAIFAPAFLFAALLGPLVERLRRHDALSAGLDGLVGVSLGLMAGVAVVLGASAVRDPNGALDAGWILVMVSAFLLALSGRVGPVIVVAGGAAVGLLRAALA